MSKDTKFSAFYYSTRKKLVACDRPLVMGILNVTDNSFYDGGRHNSPDKALSHAGSLLADGADIIDIGASSGIRLPSPAEEMERLLPTVALVRQSYPDAIISVDTCFSQTARAAVDHGADIINDISGGQWDTRMFETVAELQVPYILMHTTGQPDIMQHHCDYTDIVQDLCLYFSERLERLYSMGVKDVWIDPGFGFGKTVEQNFELLDRLGELTSVFREPILVGLSRKSMIYKTLGTTPDGALAGTIALDTKALLLGASILRVHDPKPAADTVKLLFPKTTDKQAQQ